MKGWHREPERHSLAARGIKTIPAMGRGRPAGGYEYCTGEASIEIAQGFVDAVESMFGDLRHTKAESVIENKQKLRSYLEFAYDYEFDDRDIERLHGVVMDMHRETISEMMR